MPWDMPRSELLVMRARPVLLRRTGARSLAPAGTGQEGDGRIAEIGGVISDTRPPPTTTRPARTDIRSMLGMTTWGGDARGLAPETDPCQKARYGVLLNPNST